ncbi:hypothetical protein J8I26_21185 [Herbaspirillum sp. LeCh32-8]|uniref:hypothetical protein n=1 Tax=Herbaspirillum sp. LeCh32-8 TaxID=2821356 RepID=UPI001AE47115|nr:hypothetical protein [Herbaspirillum sp. LeCh32-8]MBP0600641.1 hypothetical protein [Herbaspirillum sp. LeCh32-8]
MRCLVTYQLECEDHPYIFDFIDESPNLEKVLLEVTQFLHPEVAYEFLTAEKDGTETVFLLRQRIADARVFLKRYCGLKTLCYRVISETASRAAATVRDKSQLINSPHREAVARDAFVIL